MHNRLQDIVVIVPNQRVAGGTLAIEFKQVTYQVADGCLIVFTHDQKPEWWIGRKCRAFGKDAWLEVRDA